MAKEIRRTINFYQIKWEDKNFKETVQTHEFFTKMIEPICIKEDSDQFNIRLDNRTNSELNDDWFFGVLSKTMKEDLPQKEKISEHKVTGLGFSDDEGLYFPVHFAVFNGQILIAEFYVEGLPIKSSIENRINKRLKSNPHNTITSIMIQPIINKNIKEIIENSEIRDVEISLATDYIDEMKKKDDSILNRIKDLFIMNNFQKFEHPSGIYFSQTFSLKKKRSKKSYENIAKLKNDIISIIDESTLFDNLEKFRIIRKNEKGENEPINLKEAVFKISERFIQEKDDTKAISSKDMFNQFKDLYKKNEEELLNNIKERK